MKDILFFLLLGATVGLASWCALLISKLRWFSLELERVSKAYGELIAQTSLREADILDDLKAEREVSDNLAPIVESYVKIIDETAALLKDDKPPSIETERTALKQYHERRTHR